MQTSYCSLLKSLAFTNRHKSQESGVLWSSQESTTLYSLLDRERKLGYSFNYLSTTRLALYYTFTNRIEIAYNKCLLHYFLNNGKFLLRILFSRSLNSILCNFSYSVDLIFALKEKKMPWALKMNQLDIYEMRFFNH